MFISIDFLPYVHFCLDMMSLETLINYHFLSIKVQKRKSYVYLLFVQAEVMRNLTLILLVPNLANTK